MNNCLPPSSEMGWRLCFPGILEMTYGDKVFVNRCQSKLHAPCQNFVRKY